MSRKFLVIDTEATDTGKQDAGRFGMGARVYDLGTVVADEQGNVYETASIVISDTFHDTQAMQSAYFADKLPAYWQGIRDGKWHVMDVRGAYDTIKRMCREYDVKDVWAYNARFDADAWASTVKRASNGWCEFGLPYGVKWRCILDQATRTICASTRYAEWCESHGYVTARGNKRRTAETVVRYLRHDRGYVEQHTALADALDELEILVAALRYRKRKAKRFL